MTSDSIVQAPDHGAGHVQLFCGLGPLIGGTATTGSKSRGIFFVGSIRSAPVVQTNMLFPVFPLGLFNWQAILGFRFPDQKKEPLF